MKSNREILIDDRLKEALKAALNFEYRDLPEPEDLDYDYTFSQETVEAFAESIYSK